MKTGNSITISIDKLSITARLEEKEESKYEYTYIQKGALDFDLVRKKKGKTYASLTEYLNDVPYQVEYRSMPWNFIYQHQYNFKESGLFIQIGDYEGERVFRMEFNPNKLKKEYLTFYYNVLKRIKYVNVTRIDWAIDYPEDFTKYQIRQLSARKTIEYKSRTGKLETLYIGSPKSDIFTRIYNKALEKRMQKAKLSEWEEPEKEIVTKETLWRVEAVVKDFTFHIEQEVTRHVEHEEGSYEYEYRPKWWIRGEDNTGRMIVKEYELNPIKKRIEGAVKVKKTEKVGHDYIFQNPFKNIEIYKKWEGIHDFTRGENLGGTKELTTQEKAMLFYLEHNPEAWDELSKNTRKKYEELNYTYTWWLIDNQPSEVFEKEKYRLAQELESWLKPALDKSYFLTGYKSNIYFSLEFLKQQEGR